jgi:cysteine desulfurase
VLRAMGLTDEESYSSIRISLGRFNKHDELEMAAKLILNAVTELRNK